VWLFPADIGGYYRPDAQTAAAVMRPSATFNATLADFTTA
jgi:isocitrate dehydrogenase